MTIDLKQLKSCTLWNGGDPGLDCGWGDLDGEYGEYAEYAEYLDGEENCVTFSSWCSDNYY